MIILQLSTFQAVLATDGRLSYVLFYYDNVEGVGNDPRAVRFDAGDDTRFVNVDTGGVGLQMLHENIGNVGITGLYIFRVDSKIYSDSIQVYS